MKLLSSDKKQQNHVIRFLMVDSHQITFNKIVQSLEQEKLTAQGKLLDDLASFEKLLNLQWDVIVFSHAYDFNYEQALNIIHNKGKTIPLILLSDIDTKTKDALDMFQKGIFYLVTPHNTNLLALAIYRASLYSRLLKREHLLSIEIDKLQQQTQSLVENTEQAVAIFQEGIHSFANEQYAKIFGVGNPDNLMGFPILDTLQPKNVTEFKQFLKRLNKGDYSKSSLEIETLNPRSKAQNLTLQFSAATYEDEPALQMVISGSEQEIHSGQSSSANNVANLEIIYQQINYAFSQASKLNLFFYVLKELPKFVLQSNWNTTSQFFQALEAKIKLETKQDVVRISEHVFLILMPESNKSNSQSEVVEFVKKLPKSMLLNGQPIGISFDLRYQLLEKLPIENQLLDVLTQAFQHPYDEKQIQVAPPKPIEQPTLSTPEPVPTEEPKIHLGAPIQTIQQTTTASSAVTLIENELERIVLAQIENNNINLHFQQLYDKEDIDTHIFEITSSIVHKDKRLFLEDSNNVKLSPEIAIKLDRWVLVEASKRLHQFLPSSPKARIIVNLHAASFGDASLISLINKLVSLINSKYTRPLILQFQEEEVLTNMGEAQKFVQVLREQNVAININNFGHSASCINILQQLQITSAKLTPAYTQMLGNDEQLVELQEKLDSFKQHSAEVQYIISHLDNMTLFANAWNVDVRYLQGDYFQPKQQQFVDNAG